MENYSSSWETTAVMKMAVVSMEMPSGALPRPGGVPEQRLLDDVLRRVRGVVPEVYEEWEECKKQVHKFNGNCYKGYPTRHEAVAKWRKHQSNKSKMKMKTFLVLSLLLTVVAAVLYFILV
ncbi:hypothetical protein QYE76_057156 [Lolium multiflorum]|uniref:Ribonuclease H1 N-terminal domain-containing protein n=1 Tax=Lolium multiflorum TaxID=4521 RepID=A0AAD8T2V1_LOLMU|nr:hypothetical protein QYE76_057156 [Lolium multiflorum]